MAPRWLKVAVPETIPDHHHIFEVTIHTAARGGAVCFWPVNGRIECFSDVQANRDRFVDQEIGV